MPIPRAPHEGFPQPALLVPLRFSFVCLSFLSSARIQIGRTMFETDRLPKGWEQRINKLDYVSNSATRAKQCEGRFFDTPGPD